MKLHYILKVGSDTQQSNYSEKIFPKLFRNKTLNSKAS